MEQLEKLIQRNAQHIWHPCMQMKDYETYKPIVVNSAEGAYLKEGNKTYIDGISNWWCKTLGHNHPRLKNALIQQAEKFEHVMLANTTNETIIAFSEKLARIAPELPKLSFASDGSSAVEIALKMSLHSRVIKKQKKRTQFIALKHGFHGETCGALSVSDVGIYKKPYESLLFQTYFIQNIPYASDSFDPLWHDCSEYWHKTEAELAPYTETATALILEPMIQGAGGMHIYSPDFLKRLRQWTKANDIHLIADEIMTGIGRTGKMLACDHTNVVPDFICLSKGLTSGWLPFSVVMTTNKIYDLFYDDYTCGKTFFHSHTHAGNALAASVALETLNIVEEENLCNRAKTLGGYMYQALTEIANETQKLTDVRGLGALAAAQILTDGSDPRLGFNISQKAIELGALIRPLGNTLYWMLPLNADFGVVEELKAITMKAINEVTLC